MRGGGVNAEDKVYVKEDKKKKDKKEGEEVYA